jgi:hypothetical protein
MYQVVLERENNPAPIKFKWWIDRHDGVRVIHLDEGAAPTMEDAAKECELAYQKRTKR